MRRYPPHSRNTLPFSRFHRPTLPLLARLLGRNSHYPLRYQFIYLGRMKGLVCLGGAAWTRNITITSALLYQLSYPANVYNLILKCQGAEQCQKVVSLIFLCKNYCLTTSLQGVWKPVIIEILNLFLKKHGKRHITTQFGQILSMSIYITNKTYLFRI